VRSKDFGKPDGAVSPIARRKRLILLDQAYKGVAGFFDGYGQCYDVFRCWSRSV
jgi:hypothetical protein